MSSPFACLLFPFAGFIVLLAASILFTCRDKSWYFVLWLPTALWCLYGTLVFLSNFGLLLTISGESGEAAGFAGVGAIMALGRTLFFVLGFILSCIARPKRKNLRPHLTSIAIFFTLLLWLVCVGLTAHHDPNRSFSFRKTSCYYGKVVDENGNSISGAIISYGANSLNELRQEIYNKGTVISDKRGIFKIDGVRGINLFLQLSHSNYYSYPGNSTGFDKRSIPKKGYFSDTEEKAELFHMHSKGRPVPLIHKRGGADVPINGGYATVQFYGDEDKKIVGTLRIEANGDTPKNWSPMPYDWAVQLFIPDGGLLESTNQFDFIAPISGYQSSVKIVMNKDQANWSDSVNKLFFIKLQNGYLRMQIHIRAKTPIYTSLDYYYNPDGTQNLEPQ